MSIFIFSSDIFVNNANSQEYIWGLKSNQFSNTDTAIPIGYGCILKLGSNHGGLFKIQEFLFPYFGSALMSVLESWLELCPDCISQFTLIFAEFRRWQGCYQVSTFPGSAFIQEIIPFCCVRRLPCVITYLQRVWILYLSVIYIKVPQKEHAKASMAGMHIELYSFLNCMV